MRLDFLLLAFGFSFVLEQICKMLIRLGVSQVYVWLFLFMAALAIGLSIARLVK